LSFLKPLFLATVTFALIWSSISCSEERTNRPFTLNTDKITQGSLVIGKLKSGYAINLNGTNLPITAGGYFVFGIGRDEIEEVTLVTFLTKARKKTSQLFVFKINQRDWKIEHINGLPKSKVNPRSKKLRNRIKKETILVKQARAVKSQRTDFISSLIKPAQGRISGVYGSQRILNGFKKQPHYGQDIANKIGTPVIAPISGMITLAESSLFFSGGTIIIDHGFGVSTTYLHLSQINVKVGQEVNQSDKIGEIGATGRVTGPHLDWRLNWNTTRLDPALLVKSR